MNIVLVLHSIVRSLAEFLSIQFNFNILCYCITCEYLSCNTLDLSSSDTLLCNCKVSCHWILVVALTGHNHLCASCHICVHIEAEYVVNSLCQLHITILYLYNRYELVSCVLDRCAALNCTVLDTSCCYLKCTCCLSGVVALSCYAYLCGSDLSVVTVSHCVIRCW